MSFDDLILWNVEELSKWAKATALVNKA